jgi:TonB-linked SusC/RagA family outer membrane protein
MKQFSFFLKTLFLTLCFLLLGVNYGKAQDVAGTVTDMNGNPLVSVTVILTGSKTGTITNFVGTITDLDGNYKINLPQSAKSLTFSYIGFVTQTVAINGRSQIDVSLQEDARILDEVVVIGYGTVKKSDLTGSVSSLTKRDLNVGIITSADQLIAGRATGVNIVQNSSEPGGGVSVLIRGVSSVTAGSEPLYVIDGVPISNESLLSTTGPEFGLERTPRNPLSSINPQDIESIEVLKDASSTAIFGSRGSNGVIIITTKKGKEGSISINYNATVGLMKVANRLDLLNPQDYKRILNEIIADGGGTVGADVTDIVGDGTNWLKELERPSGGLLTSNSISVSGGSATTNYYLSVNQLSQDGVLINSGLKTYSVRSNVETKFHDNLRIGLNLSASRTDDTFLSNTDGTNERAGAIFTASHYDPTVPIKNEDGSYYLSPFLSEDNPLALAYGERATAMAYRTLGNLFAEYYFTKAFSFKVSFGADVINKRRDEFNSFITKTGGGKRGFASVFEITSANLIAEATTSYIKQFNDNNYLNFIGGATIQSFENRSFNTNAQGFPTDILGTNNIGLGTPTLFTSNSHAFGNKLVSFFGRVNYNYLNKYLLTATWRTDGSSRFGKNNKWGIFPSFAFAYKLSNEKFMETFDLFDELKIRASWGRTGNQDIGNYTSLSTFSSGPTAIFNESLFLSLVPSRRANPDLKWETTAQWDFGIDMTLFNGRLFTSMDYYFKKTYDMLVYLPLPMSTGFQSVLRNIGEMDNNGFELFLESRNIVGVFNWKTSVNLSTNKNSVISLGNIPEIITGSVGFVNEISIIKPGAPINSFYGYEVIGVWQTDDDFGATVDNVKPGDLKFRDMNNDKTVNADDRKILGNSFPDLIWGLANDFTYKNFGLNFFIEGMQGMQILNNHLVDSYFPIEFRRNREAIPYLNRWTPDNPSDFYPSFVNPNTQGLKPVNTRTVQDASYARLKTITLSYNVPVKNIFIKSANISITGQNLLTLTDYKGVDPASNGSGNPSLRVENNVYPYSKGYLLSVGISF